VPFRYSGSLRFRAFVFDPPGALDKWFGSPGCNGTALPAWILKNTSNRIAMKDDVYTLERRIERCGRKAVPGEVLSLGSESGRITLTER